MQTPVDAPLAIALARFERMTLLMREAQEAISDLMKAREQLLTAIETRLRNSGRSQMSTTR